MTSPVPAGAEGVDRDDLVTSARKRAAELMDNLRETQGWHDGATMLALASELRALRAALAAAEQRAADAEGKIAALREHTLDSNPALRQLHSQAVAYSNAVVALQKVRGGAPLSTSLAWLIEQGYLVPADPDAAAVRAEERDRLAAAEQRADTAEAASTPSGRCCTTRPSRRQLSR